MERDGSYTVEVGSMEKATAKTRIAEAQYSKPEIVERAVLAIYARQTPQEQMVEETQESNGRGFTAFDAELLSSFAKQLKKGWKLSPRQFEIARRRMQKYAGQLAEIATTKEAEKEVPPAPLAAERKREPIKPPVLEPVAMQGILPLWQEAYQHQNVNEFDAELRANGISA